MTSRACRWGPTPNDPGLRAPREAALEIFRAGLSAADPHRLLAERSRLEKNRFLLDGAPLCDLTDAGRALVVGAGKAAASLAQAIEETLGSRIASGRIVVKHGHGLPLTRIQVEEGGHPLPDAAGLSATERLLRDVHGLSPDDVVFFLLTGGASALLVAPAPGLSLDEKVATTRLLLASGATIQEMNAVRKHLSAVKGGRLAGRMAPAASVTLIVSDVVGDDLSSIGSGPTAPDPTTFADACGILDCYGLRPSVPAPVREALEAGARGEREETPKPGDRLFEKHKHVILASNRLSLDAAEASAAALGFATEIFARDMVGSTHVRAKAFAARLLIAAKRGKPLALLAGGETTLEVKGKGLGGRNQEFALVVAREIEGEAKILVLAAGTDGTDGPTDAAGALADGGTLSRAREAGMDPEALLADNDSYRLFDRLGDLVRTGPTGTNVMDLVVGLVGRP